MVLTSLLLARLETRLSTSIKEFSDRESYRNRRGWPDSMTVPSKDKSGSSTIKFKRVALPWYRCWGSAICPLPSTSNMLVKGMPEKVFLNRPSIFSFRAGLSSLAMMIKLQAFWMRGSVLETSELSVICLRRSISMNWIIL